MPIGAVVADANVLLSAAVGNAASRVFTEFEVRVHVAAFNHREVERYLPAMAVKYRLPGELVIASWRLLPLEIHEFDIYQNAYGAAVADLRGRDPEDAHALASARVLRLSLWTNDKDLPGRGVVCLTTARLLRALEKGTRHKD